MTYGVIIDIHAPFGFIIFEFRDKYQRPLDSTKPAYLALFVLAKELVNKKARKLLTIDTSNATIQQDEFDHIPGPVNQAS